VKLKEKVPRVVYGRAAGSHVRVADLPSLGPLVESIVRKHRGVRAQKLALVEAARDKRSVAHRYFTWDQAKAAEMCRLEEARHLINSITWVVVREERKVETRRFQVVHHNGEREFVPTSVIVSDRDMKTEMETAMRRDLVTFYNRYKAWRDVSDDTRKVFDVLEALGLGKSEAAA